MFNEEEEKLIKISREVQKKSDIDYIINVFEMMESGKYSDLDLSDFRDFLVDLIDR